MEEKKIEMERVKKELDDKHEAINKLRQSEVEINAKLDDYKRTLLDNRKKADHWEGQRDRLELQRIDDEPDEDLKLELFHGEQLEELIQSKQAIKMEIAEIESEYPGVSLSKLDRDSHFLNSICAKCQAQFVSAGRIPSS